MQVALLGLVALALSGCDLFLVALESDPGSSASPLWIEAPANFSQLAGSDTLPVDIRLNEDVRWRTLRVTLFRGSDLDTPIDLTPTLRRTKTRATANVPISEVGVGFGRIVATARLKGDAGLTRVDAVFSHEPDIDASRSAHCEVLGQSRCLLPFPSDRFTVADASTATGRRVQLDPEAMPTNANGVAIDPTEWNRNDGFSPGSALVAHVPGIDLERSGLTTIERMSEYSESDAGVVVVDTASGERWPVWAELDAWASSEGTRALIVRPARNFLEGHRYVVALRHLRDATGRLLAPSREFVVLRDRIPTFIPGIEARRPAMERTLADLAAAGIPRDDLFLAWEFTVASRQNLTERVLHMRDDAYRQLAGAPPTFTITSVTDDVSSTIWRRVRGTIEVPLYLTGTGAPGSRIRYGTDGRPARNGSYAAPFVCNIPRSVYPGTGTAVDPGRALVYGHGLLGSRDEVNGFGTLLDAHRFVACATDWIGMSSGDIGNVAAILGDLSRFPTLADRVQQAFINFQMLANLMRRPDGFASHAAFRAGAPATAVLETGAVFFNGNSQGGILGGGATAISKEWTRAVLGVPAINFSTLLTRSVHWDTFAPVLFAAYPDELDRTIGYTLLQMLWDRAEGNGYAHHMTDDPLPGTPPHQVLLIEAFGDHQVANVATETQARTIGAKLWTPPLAPGRSNLDEPFFSLEPVPHTPYVGSVLVVWDFGTPAPPTENVPPRPPAYGEDPHGKGAAEPRVAQQVSDFLQQNGFFADRCGGGPCQSDV